MRAIFWFGIYLISSAALAMPTPIHVKPGVVTNPLRSNMFANGGQAQDEFSLLGVESKSTSSGERLSLDYGDRFGKPLKGEPGFFQVALDHDGRRITIDLSQVTRTGVDPAQLRKVLAKSKFVAASEMTMDPHDLSTNLTLTLRAPVELRLSTETGARSRVNLDLKGSAQ